MTTINRNSIVWEMDDLQGNNLVNTFGEIVQSILKKERADVVMELLETCDFFNSGLYEQSKLGNVTNVQLTYFTKSETVRVSLKYGNYDEEKGVYIARGNNSGLWKNGLVEWTVSYWGSQTDRSQLNNFEGYRLRFNLHRANK